ncbi:periplasmic protease [Owenweeksia hongkongensis DSM 17368]|uniref:Periplasmic protease n=1 Tax=Owenweeksia hongkongensis (strain DSM 17368 / CIP 108786 / JCM 12287 / NRRL B-23963 / UST20020801) TaxID=926562 RepID=G8QZG9_OWEHD|nr:S41 family peptidase [Owenweeksia hongkongensis]AEV32597.1 periplasmic protease [Owenweeksia hongkongensis DSM 17368]
MSNEGHFNVGDWEDTVHYGFLKNNYRYFPFSIKMVDGRVFIWDNYSNDSSLKRGDEIISINGNSIQSIIGRMYKCISSDGNIENNLRVRLQSGFAWMYYLFEAQPEFFDLAVIKFSSQTKTKVNVEALTRSQMGSNFSSRNETKKGSEPEKKGELYDLSFQDSVAFLVLKTFDWKVVEDGKYDAKKLYKKLFTQIKENGAEVLVIDLRDNTGGRNEFAMEMIPYIIKGNDQGEVYKTSISWKVKSKTYKMPKRSRLAFDGKIFTLTNAWTYSAGASLARYLAEYGGAFSVGSETGSRYEGFAAGSKQAVNLPSSGIKVGIPRYVYVFPNSKKEIPSNRGLIPDFPTYPTLGTYMDEIDLEMQKVINLIKDCATCHL